MLTMEHDMSSEKYLKQFLIYTLLQWQLTSQRIPFNYKKLTLNYIVSHKICYSLHTSP